MSPQSIALWCAIPLAIGVAIDSLELVADRAQLQEGGLYGYAVLATGRPMTLWGPLAPLFGAVFRYPAVLGLAGAQMLGATCLLLAATVRTPALIAPAGLACLLIMASRMLLYVRNQLGLDGADQMTLVVCTGLGVALLVPDHGAQVLAVDYIAAQLRLPGGGRFSEAQSHARKGGLLERDPIRVLGSALDPVRYPRGACDHRDRPRLPHLDRGADGPQQLRVELRRGVPGAAAVGALGRHAVALTRA